MIRGDSESITISCKNANGEKEDFTDGDIIYFTVKRHVKNESKVLQKVITEFVDGNAIVVFYPEDTKELEFREYVYDVQWTRADGTVTTIIPPSKFIIESEVTYE